MASIDEAIERGVKKAFEKPVENLGGRSFNQLLAEFREKEIVPVVHARWMVTDAYPHNVYCSECYKTFAQTHWAVWEDGSLPRDFCPNCGAKMDKEDEHGNCENP